MRLRATAFAVCAFGLAAGGAWQIGRAATDQAERHFRSELSSTLAEAGLGWVQVRADGLVLVLSGRAPDEASRFHALELARATSGFGRIEDQTGVAEAIAPPAFALELLRSDDDLSLIGLAPAAGTRDAVADALDAAGIEATVTEMLETADHPAPAGWDAALGFGLDLIAEMPRAKVSVAPGRVSVAAVAESEADRDALAARLEAAAPASVTLHLDLSAPRPVLAPFTFAFRKSPTGAARLVACSAETEADAETILSAARAAGAGEDADCTLGLGAPSPDWAGAAAEGIETVSALGGGSFALNDMNAVLVGPPDMDGARFAEIAAEFERNLPPVFVLSTRSAAPAETEEISEAPVPEFHAVLEDGSVRLAGPVADRSAQIAILGFAEAVFGHRKVESATVLDPNLPDGWPVRVLSAVEALALLEDGRVEVTADNVTVSGRSLEPEAERELAAFFDAKAAGDVILDVEYDSDAAAALAESMRSPAEICAERVQAILSEEMITFGVGSAEIEDESIDVVQAIADVLAECPGARFEVAGYTDSKGKPELNQKLSERRAAAVAEALDEAGAFLVGLEPRGYGPDRPIADNDTEEGRARNRRIEFSLLSPSVDAEETAGLEATEPESSSADEEPDTDAEPAAEEAETDGED